MGRPFPLRSALFFHDGSLFFSTLVPFQHLFFAPPCQLRSGRVLRLLGGRLGSASTSGGFFPLFFFKGAFGVPPAQNFFGLNRFFFLCRAYHNTYLWPLSYSFPLTFLDRLPWAALLPFPRPRLSFFPRVPVWLVFYFDLFLVFVGPD